MSFTPRDLTTGGQMMSYNLRMFAQVNTWISAWIFILFLLMTAVITWAVTPGDALRNGLWYWCASANAGLLPLMDGKSVATWDVVWTCAGQKTCTTKMTLAQVIADPWMKMMADTLSRNLRLTATGCGVFCCLLFTAIVFGVGRSGRKNRSDEILSGMRLAGSPAEVNRLLRKNGQRSDLRIGDLSMVKHAEVMNFLIHGTIGVGKSTMIRWLLEYIRRRGDRAIIFDSGCTFVETHYDPQRDVIMSPHDERCPNWDLWRECREVVDYENLTASLIPEEGESDPFWVSSSRTIFADAAMKMASDPERSIEKFLTLLLSMGLKDLRDYLRNMPSANLVEEKIEKTAISIRSVVTNYAKSLRYLQGLDRDGRPGFSIREWMTDERYDSSWMFISTTARHRKAVRPLISMWLSLATIHLQSMGENSDRRVWFVLDEIASLQKIPELSATLAEARKFGGCFVLGIQNIAQLVSIYGQHVARSILDLLNTRAYGRSPSAEVAKMVQDELGMQRRREAREQNSFGLDQVRDGISLSRDKVQEPVVDYDAVMSLDNLKFYVRLPGEYPVVKLALKYRPQKKINQGLIERDFSDALSPALEQIITENEKAGGLSFPEAESPGSAPVATVKPRQPQKASPKPATPPAAGVATQEPAKSVVPVALAVAAEAASSPPATGPTRGAAVLTLVPGGRASVPEPASPAADPVPAPALVEPVDPAAQADPPVAHPEPALPAAEPAPPPAVAEPDAPPAQADSPVVRPEPAAPAVTPRIRQPFLPASARSLNPADENDADESDETAATSDGGGAAAAGGEAPELNMEATLDDRDGLVLRTAGVRRAAPDEREQVEATPHQGANRAMAEEEKNILRHHREYEEYSSMSHDDEGFER